MTRIMSSLILFPLVLILIVFGDIYVIDGVFTAVALLAMNEFYNAFKEKANPVKWIGYVACFLIAFLHIIPANKVAMAVGLGLPIVFFILFLQVIITNMKTSFNDIAITFFGICYIVGFTMFIPLIIGKENGKVLVWYVMMFAWGTDVFAYTVGKRIGKHKFSKVSPNKSIEGCIAGIIGAIVLGLIYTYFVNTNLIPGANISYAFMALIAVGMSIASQVGDFAASSIKRYTGIKDYSNLIPGHGGMLDRIDSVIFVAPFAYFIITLL